jgi:hypothetical protein
MAKNNVTRMIRKSSTGAQNIKSMLIGSFVDIEPQYPKIYHPAYQTAHSNTYPTSAIRNNLNSERWSITISLSGMKFY